MQRFYQNHKETIDQLTFFILFLLAVYVFFRFLFTYVAPFFIGLVIAFIMEPIIRWLAGKQRFSRGLASAFCLILFMLAIGVIGTLIVSNVYKQIGSFMDNAPSYIDELSRTMDDVNEWVSAWSDRMPDSLYVQFPDIKDALLSSLTTLFGDGVKDQSLRIVSNVPDFLIGWILSLVSAFFFMKDHEKIMSMIAERCPKWLAQKFELLHRGLSHAISGYFKAQFILTAIVGIICIGGLLIMGNPYALLIGLIIAVLDFLPVAGSGAVLLPWIVISLIGGQFGQAVGLTILYVIVTITRQVLQPKILGVQMGMHPLVMLLSLYAGFKLLGLFGLIFGPALVVMFKAFIETERVEKRA